MVEALTVQQKHQLVEWVRQHPRFENPISNEAFVLTMSNNLRNRAHFGGDLDFTYFDARDLICIRSMSQTNDHLIDVAYARAILDDDREAIDLLHRVAIPEEMQKWFASLQQCPKEEALRHLAKLEQTPNNEKLWLTRVVFARRWPDLIDAAWLRQCPEHLPQVAAHLAKLLIAVKPDSIPAVREHFLRDQRTLILADPEPTLALMVAKSATPPDQTLTGFEPYKCEALANAAAQWFLERGQPLGTIALTDKIRPFSRHADRARQLRGFAFINLGRIEEAAKEARDVCDQPMANGMILAIAEKKPDFVDTVTLITIAQTCDAQQPELFYKVLVALLSRKALTEARNLCRTKKAVFAANPVLSEIINKIG